jgi:hypothetical protein
MNKVLDQKPTKEVCEAVDQIISSTPASLLDEVMGEIVRRFAYGATFPDDEVKALVHHVRSAINLAWGDVGMFDMTTAAVYGETETR